MFFKQKMQVVQVQEFGAPEVLQIAQIDMPKIGPHDVLIKVAASGINRADILQRKGFYPPPKGITDILGLEVSGEVVECGEKADQFSVGDKVCALLAGGGYSQYCVVRQDLCLPIPDGYSFEEAAALPEAVFTVWKNLFQLGQLKKGETVLIHGGSGGIGSLAIEMSKIFGIKVITTVRNKTKADFCESIGADHTILYRTSDFVEIVDKLTESNGVDCILDMVGGNYTMKNLHCLADGGRLVQIAYLQNKKVEIDLSLIMKRHLNITGSTLRNRPLSEKIQLKNEIMENVWPYILKGQIKPKVFEKFSLKDVVHAHHLMEGYGHSGKLVLIPD